MIFFRRASRQQSTIDPNAEILRTVESSGLFDAEWYLYRYPDVATFSKGPLVHFCTNGLEELREPSPHFSLAKYLVHSPEARKAALPAFLHALPDLTSRGRDHPWMPDDEATLEYLVNQHALFDEPWYVAENRDVAHSGLRPIQHFLRHGAYELRDPSPRFDSEFYRDTYPNYLDRSSTPVEHYVRIGSRLGHVTTGRSKYDRWLQAFDVLTEEDLGRIANDGAGTASVVAIHVIDKAAFAHVHFIIQRWREQVAASCSLRFVRGADLLQSEWKEFESRIGSDPRVAVVDPTRAFADILDGAVVVLCAGAVLVRSHLAYVLSRTLVRFDVDAAYADHDHIDDAGVRSKPCFKPAMSPEFMRGLPYAGAVVSFIFHSEHRDRLALILGEAVQIRAKRDWASYWSDQRPARVKRVPFLLFHVPTGLAVQNSASPQDTRARVDAGEAPLSDGHQASVTVIIPTRDHVDLLEQCIDSILGKTSYPLGLVEVVIVDNDSQQPATLVYLSKVADKHRAKIVSSPGPFNFSKICNDGADQATGEVLVFLNNDITVNQSDWLGRLLEYATRPHVGVVGTRLLYPDGTVQHGGQVLGVQGVAAHRYAGMAVAEDPIDITREMVSMTGACIAVRRAVFQEVGGFDPVLQVAFNDVDLCAKAYTAGYTNIYVGKSLLFHHESRSRGFDDTRVKRLRNVREAIYVRERHGALFRDDPSYSPNLSLKVIDDLATPPRVIRPWRRSAPGQRRMLLLSWAHGLGHGVATVINQQALFFKNRGWDIVIGGPMRERDLAYVGCRRVDLWTAEAAAAFAANEGIDCVIAHTPPFFSITRYVGPHPFIYFVDHGEPTPRLFPDWQAREDVDWEKRFCTALAHRVFAISQAIRRQQYRTDAVTIRNGNSHLATWSEDWASKRQSIRKRLGFEGCYIALNVCRFGRAERFYKGVERYGQVASDAPMRHPQLQGNMRFVLAGRGNKRDVAKVQAMGLMAFANVSDAEMTELYVASDLYVSLSEWEGYNLGIGQAQAMGLDAIASDIDAHREFGVDTFSSVPDICTAIASRYAAWTEASTERRAKIESWNTPLERLASLVEADLETAVPTWF